MSRISVADPISDQVITFDTATSDLRRADGTPVSREVATPILVRAVIAATGWSSRELGLDLDVDPRSVRRWKSGETAPDIGVVTQLAILMAGRTPPPAAENPVILATLVAGMLGSQSGEDGSEYRDDLLVNRARSLAAAIDRGAAASKRVREQTPAG